LRKRIGAGDLLAAQGAATSRPSGEWNDDDFDVLADGAGEQSVAKR